MAAIVNQNFTKHLGDDFVIQIVVDDVVSLDGFSLRWVLCSDEPAADPASPLLFDKTNSGQDPHIYTTQNVAFIKMPSADTNASSDISPGSYYHELHGLDDEGIGGVLGTGTATFLPTRIGR